jgi:hypothetical protein
MELRAAYGEATFFEFADHERNGFGAKVGRARNDDDGGRRHSRQNSVWTIKRPS